MDLNELNLERSANDGAELTLEHPVTGAPIDIKIKVSGIDSSAYRNKQREIQNRRLAKLSRGKKPDFSNSDAEACELLSACTLGWDGVIENGEAIEFSEKAAFELYENHLWIREQVDSFIGDRANFFTVA